MFPLVSRARLFRFRHSTPLLGFQFFPPLPFLLPLFGRWNWFSSIRDPRELQSNTSVLFKLDSNLNGAPMAIVAVQVKWRAGPGWFVGWILGDIEGVDRHWCCAYWAVVAVPRTPACQISLSPP